MILPINDSVQKCPPMKTTCDINTACEATLTQLREYIERRDYAGYDPFDALNSSLLRALSFNTKYGRIAWTQFIRRCPINLRPLLLVHRGHNPKALGLFLEGYIRLYRLAQDETTRQAIQRLLDLLEETRTTNCSGHGWGYNFDWQSKAFWVPKFTPTIVNSSFIGHALLDAWETMGLQQALDLALPIKEFMVNDLNRIEDEKDTFCFSYTPLDTYAVHNANLLGASLLYRISQQTDDTELRSLALKALAYSMRYQRTDGSWWYSEQQKKSWIDSFHTGFNLEAIRWFLDDPEAAEYKEGYEKGVRFYAENFFLEDATPKYYHDQIYPIDIHAPAEAIYFFAGEGEKYRELTDRIMQWMLRNMYSGKGYFYFRKGKRFTNRIPYMRWSQAWAFRALMRFADGVGKSALL